MKHDNLTVILNKIYAMHRINLVTLREIGKAIGATEQQVSGWITQRTRQPRAEIAFKLQAFASKYQITIAMNRRLQPQYRAAYKEACEKFPTHGK
jgi:hypothetical protein